MVSVIVLHHHTVSAMLSLATNAPLATPRCGETPGLATQKFTVPYSIGDGHFFGDFGFCCFFNQSMWALWFSTVHLRSHTHLRIICKEANDSKLETNDSWLVDGQAFAEPWSHGMGISIFEGIGFSSMVSIAVQTSVQETYHFSRLLQDHIPFGKVIEDTTVM